MANLNEVPYSDEEKIENWFTYHTPKQGEPERYEEIRFHGKQMALCLVRNCPPSADRTAAIRKIREAVMTANASIACGGH
jgi:hypothetical protein